jgi:enoyl-CoA hydratase
VSVTTHKNGPVTTIVLYRRERKNAVDGPTAQLLAAAFRAFEDDAEARVAVLYGDGGTFCAGADLKAMATPQRNHLSEDGDGPMGPTRMHFAKPVIAAISGFAVAGGLELAAMCDLRVAEASSTMGVFCRRWGVPLIDGGTVRLPRLIGLSRAMDLILTGRAVGAEEALSMGLVNRVVPDGQARVAAEELAARLAELPRTCMLSDRKSAYESYELPFEDAMKREFSLGMATLMSGESLDGAARFASGEGRHGAAPGVPEPAKASS